jgi:hypothetical protein
VARKIKLKYEGRCRKCGQTIPTGTKAYWEPKRGIWHLECRPDKNVALILNRPLAFKRKEAIRSPVQPSRKPLRSVHSQFKIPRSTQLGLILALVIFLAFGGLIVSTNFALQRPTSHTEIENQYTTEISYVTPTLTTTETIYATETTHLTLTYTTRTGTRTTPSSKGMFVGSRLSNIYHWPSCYWARQISPKNEIWFKDSADARAHGYRPCKVCKPP